MPYLEKNAVNISFMYQMADIYDVFVNSKKTTCVFLIVHCLCWDINLFEVFMHPSAIYAYKLRTVLLM